MTECHNKMYEKTHYSNMAVFSVDAPCSLVNVLRRFRGTRSLHHHGGDCTSETSLNFYQTTRNNNPEVSCVHKLRREQLEPQSYKDSRTFSSSASRCAVHNILSSYRHTLGHFTAEAGVDILWFVWTPRSDCQDYKISHLEIFFIMMNPYQPLSPH
jgi:hypothetical protein